MRRSSFIATLGVALALLAASSILLSGCSHSPSEPPPDAMWPPPPPPPVPPGREPRAEHHSRPAPPVSEPEPQPEMELDVAAIPVPTALAQSALLFGLAIYNTLAQEPGNVVISPYDLVRVMAMAHAGANQRAGEELATVINLPVGPRELFAGVRTVSNGLDASGDLHEGNAVVIAQDTGLSDAMRTKLVEAFGPHVEHEAIADVAQGASSFLAQGDISSLKGTDRAAADSWRALGLESSRLALLGTSTYQSGWHGATITPKRRHYSYRFRDGKMHDIHTFAPQAPTQYCETEEYRALQLPFAGGRFALLVLRPKKVKSPLTYAPNANDLQYIIDHLAPATVDIDLPAFYVSTPLSLTSVIRALGAQSLFDPSRSELSNLGPAGNGLYARDLLHGVVIQVNEKGVKLHAYSALKFNGDPTHLPRRRGLDSLETPFLFILRDTTWGMPIVMGRIETL